MKVKLLQEIIRNINNKHTYTIDIGGKVRELSGVNFKSHIITTYKKINVEDLQKLYDSLTVKQVEQAVESAETIVAETKKSKKNKDGM
jgi:hypothetical protein